MTYALKAPARYVQGAGELERLGRNLKKLGNRFLLIGSDNSWNRFGERVRRSLEAEEKQVVFGGFCGEATKEEVFSKMDLCKAQSCDGVIGMGGGKAWTRPRPWRKTWACPASSYPLWPPTTPRAAVWPYCTTSRAWW